MRGLSSVFAEWLGDYAMVREWLALSPTDRLVLTKETPVVSSVTDAGDLTVLRSTCKEILDSIEFATGAGWIRADNFRGARKTGRPIGGPLEGTGAVYRMARLARQVP